MAIQLFPVALKLRSLIEKSPPDIPGKVCFSLRHDLLIIAAAKKEGNEEKTTKPLSVMFVILIADAK